MTVQGLFLQPLKPDPILISVFIRPPITRIQARSRRIRTAFKMPPDDLLAARLHWHLDPQVKCLQRANRRIVLPAAKLQNYRAHSLLVRIEDSASCLVKGCDKNVPRETKRNARLSSPGSAVNRSANEDKSAL